MSDSPPSPEPERSEPQQTILDNRQQGLNLPLPPALQSMVELERQRIESFNKRTDVARYAIETNDAADRRQFEYQMAKLAADKEATERRHRLLRLAAIGGGSFSLLLIGTLIGMAFLGRPEQADMALSILKVLGIAVGGYGVISGAVRGVRRLSE